MASKTVMKKTDTKIKEVKKNAKTAAACQTPTHEHLKKANNAMSKAWAQIAQRSKKQG